MQAYLCGQKLKVEDKGIFMGAFGLMYRHINVGRNLRLNIKAYLWGHLVKYIKAYSCGQKLEYIHCRVFLKGHFVKKKCSPHHVTGGYLERSYPEGETDQTSLGGRH